MLSFQEVIEKRRTNYALGKHIPVSQIKLLKKTIRSVVPEVPSAFNMQSLGNIIVAFGENHQKIWDITKKYIKRNSSSGKFFHNRK